MKLFIIQKELQIFSTIFSILSAKKPTLLFIQKLHLTNKNPNSFFLIPIEKEEIKMICLSPDTTKATGLYSIPTKNLKLLKNDISNQLANL